MTVKFELFQLLTFTASIVAVWVSFLNYRRGARIENENYLYKAKVEAYSKILGSLDRLIWFLYDTIQKANKPDLFNLGKTELNQMADEIDDRIYDFSYLVVDCSLLITDDIDEKLSQIAELMFAHDESVSVENYKEYHKKILQLSNELNEIMREDLQIEVLNESLFKRLSDKTLFSEILIRK